MRVIRLDYEIKVKGGELIESSNERGPLEFVLGQRRLLPALEAKIADMKVGEEKRGVLPAAEAFGDESQLPTKEIRKSEFPTSDELVVGRVFEARATETQSVSFRIVAVGPETVTVKFLHPLAGADLEYRLKVIASEPVAVRRAPPPVPAAALGIDSNAIRLTED